MPNEFTRHVLSMSDDDAVIAARALIPLLDVTLQRDPSSQRLPRAQISDLNKLIRAVGEPVAGLLALLQRDHAHTETAAVARALLLVALGAGYNREVEHACNPALIRAVNTGPLTGPQIVASLAVVLGWIPTERRSRVQSLPRLASADAQLRLDGDGDNTGPISDEAMTFLDRWWQNWMANDAKRS